MSEHKNNNSQSSQSPTLAEDHVDQPPSTKRRRKRLDDSDVSEEELDPPSDFNVDGNVLHAPGPLEAQEADTGVSANRNDQNHSRPCVRLHIKTKAADAHPKYAKYQCTKQKPIEYKATSKFIEETKKDMQNKFDMRSTIRSSRHIDIKVKLALILGAPPP